jgi:hypothetical protein
MKKAWLALVKPRLPKFHPHMTEISKCPTVQGAKKQREESISRFLQTHESISCAKTSTSAFSINP